MNNFIKKYIILIFITVSIVNFSQNKTKISGRVLDLETSKPISYASVYLASAAIGTTTNDDGFFTFYIPNKNQENSITISMIGYLSISKKATDFNKNETIFLSSKTTDLEEIVIKATKKKQLTAKEIVRKAYQEIDNNYPTKPYILEGYVRDLQKEENKYVEYLECAAKFLYQGYKTKREPLVEILGVKTNYLGEKHPWNKNSERKNSIIDLVEDDLIRFDYGPIKGKNGWKYELESILPYKNRLVYKIKGIDKPYQKTTLYIDSKTFAFIRIELIRKAKKNSSWKRRFSNGALQVYYNLVIEYQEINGKMYLKYQKEEDTWRIFKGLESNKVLFTKYPKKELFINKIVIDNVKNYPFKRNMDIGASIENQAKEFDLNFWNSYNIPKQTEGESKIISELRSRAK
jgi:hypothetical protein